MQRSVRLPADLAQPVQVELTFDGTAEPSTCVSRVADTDTADGCMTLVINNGEYTLIDFYGTVSDQAVELATGAHPGWWAFGFGEDQALTGGACIDYDLTIIPTVVTAPQTADDCKDGGHEAFGFKNQGQCVASVQANDNANI